MKNWLILVLILLSAPVIAVPNIGITGLLFQNGVKANTQLTATESGAARDLITQQLISKFKQQLPKFQSELTTTLAQSSAFKIFDGEPIVKLWQKQTPQILSTLAAGTVVAKESAAINAKAQPVTASSPLAISAAKRYILLGWISQVTANEDRQPFPDTSKTSLLYNLDIWVEYKLIDADTQQIITQFIAVGHAGVAKILATPDASISYNTDALISDAFHALAFDVQHGLLVKRQQDSFD